MSRLIIVRGERVFGRSILLQRTRIAIKLLGNPGLSQRPGTKPESSCLICKVSGILDKSLPLRVVTEARRMNTHQYLQMLLIASGTLAHIATPISIAFALAASE